MGLLSRFNLSAIAKDPAKWAKIVELRGMSGLDIWSLVAEYERHRGLLRERDSIARSKNSFNSSAGGVGQVDLGREFRQRLDAIDKELVLLEAKIGEEAALLPNDIHRDCPLDHDRVLEEFNTDCRDPADPQDHITVLTRAGWLDMSGAIAIAGHGFAVLKGTGAMLEHALVRYALGHALSRGFTLLTVPDLVREEVVREGSGFAPKRKRHDSNSSDPVYKTDDGLVLAGTAEMPLLAMHSHQTFGPQDLPIRLTALGHAFRREAGNHGTASRGLYRLHQFTKVELFSLAHPDRSEQAYEDLFAAQLEIIKGLGFRGRVLEMSARELGASAFRKRDIELWLPHSRRWGEVTSASNCTDYQARRLDIRYRSSDGKGHVHTLNATAMAVPRIIQCIAEYGLQVPRGLEPLLAVNQL